MNNYKRPAMAGLLFDKGDGIQVFLVKLFVKNYEKIDDEKVRGSYGTLSSFVGIISNIILFLIKFIMGKISCSVSIVSDAFNNLSDCGSCLLTLFGYKLAAKPADKDHPFGHGRLEYIFSLVVAALILIVGIDLFKTSVTKVIHPEKIEFSWIVFWALVFSIGMKIWMSIFNKTLGNKINSSVMLATSKDSFSDAIATSATLIALVVSRYSDVPLDGIMGCVVSVIILIAGFNIIKETVDELLGKAADPEVVQNIKKVLMDNPSIIGVHDMIIHNYGPGTTFGSVHAEVDSKGDIMCIHDAIDEVERKVYEDYKVILTIHMDPVETDNEEINKLKGILKSIINEIDEKLTFHDFRMVSGPSHTNLIFDVVIPFDVKIDEETIKEQIDSKITEKAPDKDKKYYTVITFDRAYVET